MAGMRLIGCALLAASLLAQEASPFLAVPTLPGGLRFDTLLPAFQTRDIAGRTWRLDDLRGKYTLIYLWHTFEARSVDAHNPRLREIVPGLSDLPEVQRFYDKVRATQTIQVLTFCRDYDYTHAPEYMKEKSYSFPVIADWTLAKKLFAKAAGNAPYLVVDREGRLSNPIRSWSLGRVLYEIEAAAR
jgi:hypothetical protein